MLVLAGIARKSLEISAKTKQARTDFDASRAHIPRVLYLIGVVDFERFDWLNWLGWQCRNRGLGRILY